MHHWSRSALDVLRNQSSTLSCTSLLSRSILVERSGSWGGSWSFNRSSRDIPIKSLGRTGRVSFGICAAAAAAAADLEGVVVVSEFDALSGCFGLASDESDSKPFVPSGGVVAVNVVVVPTFEDDSGDSL